MARPQPRENGAAEEPPEMTMEQADNLQRNAMFSIICFPPTGLAAVWQARNAGTAVRQGNQAQASQYSTSSTKLITISVFLALLNPILVAFMKSRSAPIE